MQKESLLTFLMQHLWMFMMLYSSGQVRSPQTAIGPPNPSFSILSDYMKKKNFFFGISHF